MSLKIIQERLDAYHCQSVQEEENAVREITQEIALAALSRCDFFKIAAFQGGTALRILYSLDRFSEDMDFILQKPQPHFRLGPYVKNLTLEFKTYGYQLEVLDRSEVDSAVKKVFLKDDSIGKVLTFKHLRANRSTRKIQIKLEIDTNPPAASHFETKFHDFPFPFSVLAQDLPSLFAGKSHALLCREYVKGRDWYDFIWYTSRRVPIHFDFLSSALKQHGPWAGQHLQVDWVWYQSEMQKKIKAIDWDAAKQDISRFLKPPTVKTLELWSANFFLAQLQKLHPLNSIELGQ